jgi:hypothetical protein
VQVLGLHSANEPLHEILGFIRNYQVTFPVLLGAADLRNIYAQHQTGSPYPLDYVIDQEGKVAYYRTEYNPDEIVATIDGLIGNAPQIDTEPEWLSFGALEVGRELSLLLDVENAGSGDLQVHTLATGTDEFGVNLESLVVPPAGSRAVLVTFAPELAGTRLDTLWLASNDPQRPLLAVPLQGIGGDGIGVGDFGPRVMRLANDPNPFGPITTIRFSLPEAGIAELQIYDVHGRLQRELIAGVRLGLGEHSSDWDGRDTAGTPLASGIYFTRLQVSGRTLTRKITLLR